jgi:hypothetical protein
MVASALHAQRAPLPNERLWQSVQEAIVASERRLRRAGITREIAVPDASGNLLPIPRPSDTMRQNWRRRALGTLAAVAAIVLVVVGFGRLFQSDVGNRQTFSVTWHQVTPAAGVGASLGAGKHLAVSPADGSVAWLCQSGTQSAPHPLRVWRTSDAGKSWQSVQLSRAIYSRVAHAAADAHGYRQRSGWHAARVAAYRQPDWVSVAALRHQPVGGCPKRWPHRVCLLTAES